jgi:hypothetical protein
MKQSEAKRRFLGNLDCAKDPGAVLQIERTIALKYVELFSEIKINGIKRALIFPMNNEP